MEQCAWSNIRIKTNHYLYLESEYGDARAKAELVLLSLKDLETELVNLTAQKEGAGVRLDELYHAEFIGGGRGGRGAGAAGGDDIQENIEDDVNLELENAQKLVDDLKASALLKKTQLDGVKADWNNKNKVAADFKEKRDDSRKLMETYMKSFFTSRWIVVLEAADLTALRVMKENIAGCRVRFSLSSSVRGSLRQVILRIATEMKIDTDVMSSDALYELSGGEFRKMLRQESSILGFRRIPE